MSVTFFAVDDQGNEPAAVKTMAVNVTNSNAIRIERWLGFRPQVEDVVDIPGGERTIDDFMGAMLAAVLMGHGDGIYFPALAELCIEAARVGGVRILWA